MQKSVSHLIALCESLDASCVQAFENDEASASDLLALPHARLIAVANAIGNVSVRRRRGDALDSMFSAKVGAADLLDRFAKCSERYLGRPISRSHVREVLAAVRVTLDDMSIAIRDLDGKCVEDGEVLD